jgi:hypothetical protein
MPNTAWKKINIEFTALGGRSYNIVGVEDSEKGLAVYDVTFGNSYLAGVTSEQQWEQEQASHVQSLVDLQKKRGNDFPHFTTNEHDAAGGIAPRVTCTAAVANEIANIKDVLGVMREEEKQQPASRTSKKPNL